MKRLTNEPAVAVVEVSVVSVVSVVVKRLGWRSNASSELNKGCNGTKCIVSKATHKTGEVGVYSTGIRELEASTFA